MYSRSNGRSALCASLAFCCTCAAASELASADEVPARVGIELAAALDEPNPTELAELLVESPPLVSPARILDESEPGRELADRLRDLAGVSGSRMGGHGTDPAIRGLALDRINVLIDGARVEGACPNRMDPATAYASRAGTDRVEVVRGLVSLEEASGPGGTVRVIRDTPRFLRGESDRLDIDAGYRDNGDGLDLAVDYAAGTPNGFVRLFANRNEAGNYTDGGGDEIRSAFEDTGIGAEFGWTPDDGQRLTVSLEERRLRDELFAGAGMDSPRSDGTLLRAAWTRDRLGLLRDFELALDRSDIDHVMDNYSLRTPPSPMMRLRAPSSSDNRGLRVRGEFPLQRGALRAGLELRGTERSALRINDASVRLQSVLWPDVGIDRQGAFLEWHDDPARAARWTVGLRYDRVRAEADAVDRAPAAPFLPPSELYRIYYGVDGRDASTEHHLGGLVRYGRPLKGGRIYAAVSRTFRTADATERYIASNRPMPSMRWVGNPTLEPERHDQLEIGWQIQRRFWGAAVSAFENRIDDFILRDRFGEPGNNATIYRNVDARYRGGEFSAEIRRRNGWRAAVEIGYVRATDLDNARPIAQTPPLEGALRIERRLSRGGFGLRVRAAARQDRVDDDPMVGSGLDAGPTPGWSVVDLFASRNLTRSWQVRAGIDNLFDREYAQHLNRSSSFDATQVRVDEPGRAVWVSLAYRHSP